MQASGVLLEDAAPGNGHGQHQGIKCRVIEPFANERTGGQEHPRRIFGQRLQCTDQRRSPFLRHAAMEREKIRDLLPERNI